jgi:hypothetical protein
MTRRKFLLIGPATVALAQKYTGPRPPKPDIPYLLHASNLVPMEIGEARQESRKDDILYAIAGANSPAQTPLAAPIFLLLAEKLQPERLQLYRLDSKNGRREILFSRKKKQTARPIRLEFRKLAEGLYRIEVNESLPNGEYSLTPEGSNQVFCFAVN